MNADQNHFAGLLSIFYHPSATHTLGEATAFSVFAVQTETETRANKFRKKRKGKKSYPQVSEKLF